MQFEKKPIRSYLGVLSVMGWFALIAQFYLIFANRTTSIPETFIRYFSFFTILTNLLVASCSTALALRVQSGLKKFFSKQESLAAITVYIFVVGLVYNIVLRPLWNPAGLQKIVDELLHTVIPVMFILFWLLFVPKNELRFVNIFSWLTYPAVYAIAILIRGSFSQFYPYPFIDYAALGLRKVTTNIIVLIAVFVIFSLIFVSIGKLMSRSRKQISY